MCPGPDASVRCRAVVRYRRVRPCVLADSGRRAWALDDADGFRPSGAARAAGRGRCSLRAVAGLPRARAPRRPGGHPPPDRPAASQLGERGRLAAPGARVRGAPARSPLQRVNTRGYRGPGRQERKSEAEAITRQAVPGCSFRARVHLTLEISGLIGHHRIACLARGKRAESSSVEHQVDGSVGLTTAKAGLCGGTRTVRISARAKFGRARFHRGRCGVASALRVTGHAA